MELRPVTNKEVWNTFVEENGPRSGAYLQSWEWKTVLERTSDVHSLGYFVEDRLLAVSHVETKSIKGPLQYFYCPRGPVASDAESVRTFLELLSHRKTDAFGVRFDAPIEGLSFEGSNMFQAPHDVQPRATLLVDLAKSTDDLLADMHRKTRYNIRVAKRRGVQVSFLESTDIGPVWKLLEGTAGRNKFRLHPKAHYQAILNASTDKMKVRLVVATVDSAPAAAAMVSDFAGTRTYMHGASEYALRERMAPFALHWFLMQDAKASGLDWYDFWGIAPTDDSTEPLAGVTRFKRGFGGEEVRYPATMDLVFKPAWYKIYRTAHKLIVK